MISLDIRFVGSDRVGEAHGLDCAALFEQNRDRMAQYIKDLYASKTQDGAWTRWLNLGEDTALLECLTAYANSVKGQFDDLVILGIGGSSLGGYALLRALLHPYWNNLTREQRGGYPRFHFIDNVDPDQMAGMLDMVDLKRTLFNVVTKSGSTAETMSALMLVKATICDKLGPDALKKHLVATTDKAKGLLRQIANEEDLISFEVPDDVGGRFSVFSAVGLLPAILCGVDVAEIQRGIRDMDAICQNPDITQNPAAQNALIQMEYYRRGRPISVFMPYSFRLASVSDWYVQLWAESLGKKFNKAGQVVHTGPSPLRSVGVTDQHSMVQLLMEGPFDKVITFVQVETPANNCTIPNVYNDREGLSYLSGKPFNKLLTDEFLATRASLASNGRPSVTLTLPKVDTYHFAQLLHLLEVQTALAGSILEIDPFDQPGVELGKQFTYALMGRKGFEHLIDQVKDAQPATAAGKA